MLLHQDLTGIRSLWKYALKMLFKWLGLYVMNKGQPWCYVCWVGCLHWLPETRTWEYNQLFGSCFFIFIFSYFSPSKQAIASGYCWCRWDEHFLVFSYLFLFLYQLIVFLVFSQISLCYYWITLVYALLNLIFFSFL